MKFYPINLNINKKLCIVIGGGKVAERKIKNILLFGGKVKVISPKLTEYLEKLSNQKKIVYIEKEYNSKFLKGAYLVFAATSSNKVNSAVAKDSGKIGVLVNVCDSLEKSAFILPAILKKNKIIISVSTNGLSPKKSVEVRDRLKKSDYVR